MKFRERDLLQFSGTESLNGSDFQGYRAYSPIHRDSHIGGTSREIRRAAEKRNRHRMKSRRKTAIGF